MWLHLLLPLYSAFIAYDAGLRTMGDLSASVSMRSTLGPLPRRDAISAATPGGMVAPSFRPLAYAPLSSWARIVAQCPMFDVRYLGTSKMAKHKKHRARKGG